MKKFDLLITQKKILKLLKNLHLINTCLVTKTYT